MASGKRLWYRTPDGRWIVPPVGAGEDHVVRSINVYGGTPAAWQTPVPASAGYYLDKALNVYAPSTQWSVKTYNPNIPWSGPRPHAEHTDWPQLFLLGPRDDPTWRVVDLSSSVPLQAPSLPLNPNTAYDIFKHRGGGISTTTTTGNTDSYGQPNGTFNTEYSANNAVNSASFAGASDRYYRNSQQTGGTEARQTSTQASMIDLVAIKAQLNARWPQSNAGIGQRNPITGMTVKRVGIIGQIKMVSSHQADNSYAAPHPPELAELFGPLQFRFYADTDVIGVYLPEPELYDPRRPAATTAVGSMFYEKNSLIGPSELDSSLFGEIWSREYIQSVVLVFDNVQDNIVITSTVSGLSPTHVTTAPKYNYYNSQNNLETGPYPTITTASGHLTPFSIVVEYASPGHDVPEDYSVRSYPSASYPMGA